MNGYIKLHRSLLENPIIMKDADHLAVWTYLLLQATFSGEVEVIFRNQRTKLRPGQFTTGRKKIAADLGISESKVQRVLNTFEREEQIKQETDYKCRLVSIVNWDKYQKNDREYNSENSQKSNRSLNTSQSGENTDTARTSTFSKTESEQVNEQVVNRWRTGGEQVVNTKEERKKEKNVNNEKIFNPRMEAVHRYRKQIGRES